jgi:cytosine/adenosine deaminase-related metal-dependent hydrolase
MTGRRTVIRGGLVLGAEGHAWLRDVLIEDGRILAIDNPGFEVSDDAKVLSAADRLLIPGLISAHTHSARRAQPRSGRRQGLAGNVPDRRWRQHAIARPRR